MKRILLIIILTVIAISAYFAWNLPSHEPTIEISEPQTSPTPVKTVDINGQPTAYAIVLARASAVSLIPNFSEKKTSSELMNTCDSGINGGFYDTDNRPLGLFTTNGITLRNKSTSALMNGFIGVTEGDVPFISTEPRENARFILQTGPFLIADGVPRQLSIKNDEHARRMVAARTTDDTLIFLALFNPDAVFDGPLLADVPVLVAQINKKELLNITEAINLDGGSASAFYGDGMTLSELTSIGSFFCVQ